MVDLYEDLGVARDASPEEIKQAGRDRAKEHHPDKGGDPDAFNRCQRALAVLRDPERRKRYDETGKADDTAPQSDPVLVVVMSAFEQALSQLQSVDPAYFDLVGFMKTTLQQNIETGTEAQRGIRRAMKDLRKARKRLKWKGEGESPLARLLDVRIKMNTDSLEGNEQLLANVRAALEWIEANLEYTVDPRPSMPHPGDLDAADVMFELSELMKRGVDVRKVNDGLRGWPIRD